MILLRMFRGDTSDSRRYGVTLRENLFGEMFLKSNQCAFSSG